MKFTNLAFLASVIACFSFPVQAKLNNSTAAPFDFASHCDPDEMKTALQTMFPRGTDKEAVENKLIDESGAIVRPDEPTRGKPNYSRYFRKVACSPENTQWSINVTYDRNGKVWQISATEISAVFSHVPPEDRSDPGIFSFDDYTEPSDLNETLRELFPLDTPRVDVEKVLVKWNMAQVWRREDEPRTVIYRHADRYSEIIRGIHQRRDRVWNIELTYIDDKVSQIRLDGSTIDTAFEHTRDYWLKHKTYQQGIVRKH